MGEVLLGVGDIQGAAICIFASGLRRIRKGLRKLGYQARHCEGYSNGVAKEMKAR
jgi:hypothetical protein